jgi:hypothetical protein
MSGLGDAIEKKIAGRGTVEIDVGGKKATVDVVDADRIGVVIERLRVDGAEGSVVDRANDLAEHLRPNGDRLVPVEVDAGLGGGTLRTAPDEMRGHFHQVEVDATGAELTRHRVGADGTRKREGLGVTREQLRSLVDTMAGSGNKSEE